MRKIKLTSIITLTTVCLIVSIATSNKNNTKELGAIQLANIEALTQSPEAYPLSDCYNDVTFEMNSQYNIIKCVSGTTKNIIYNCSAGITDKGYSTSRVYQCVK